MAIVSRNGVLLPEGEEIINAHYYTDASGNVFSTLDHKVAKIRDIFAAIRSTFHQERHHEEERREIHRYPLFHSPSRLKDIDGIEASNRKDRQALQNVVQRCIVTSNAIRECLTGDPHTKFLRENVAYPERGQQIAALTRSIHSHISAIPQVLPLLTLAKAMDANVRKVHTQSKRAEALGSLCNVYEAANAQELKVRMEELRCTLIHPGIDSKDVLLERIAILLTPISLPKPYELDPLFNCFHQFWIHLRDALSQAIQDPSLDVCIQNVMEILKTHDPLSVLQDLMPKNSSLPQLPR